MSKKYLTLFILFIIIINYSDCNASNLSIENNAANKKNNVQPKIILKPSTISATQRKQPPPSSTQRKQPQSKLVEHTTSTSKTKAKTKALVKPTINIAAVKKTTTNVKKPIVTKKLITESNNLAVFAVDADSGKVLFAKHAHEERYPASLTKLMTLYVLFGKLESAKVHLNDKIVFSKVASSKPRSKLGIPAGQSITVYEAIHAMIILSANDVATAIGEHIGGSEANFGRIMTKQAQKLKMYRTSFHNASGLFHPSQHTTASDIIRLGVALKKDFPQYYKYFSQTSFNFRGRPINGHNRITANYPGADGLKTGYVSQSGYNVVSSASRDKKNIFAVVLGGKTSQERDAYMVKILDASFSKLENKKIRL